MTIEELLREQAKYLRLIENKMCCLTAAINLLGLSALGNIETITIATANGISGTSSGGINPTLTLTLGAITPTSVNGITFVGTAATTMTFPTTSATIARTDAGQVFTGVNQFASSFGTIETIAVAASDETTAITTGTAKTTFRMPYAFTLIKVKASLTTTSSSGLPTFDINEGGTTILSTKLTIDVGELTSKTAATPAVISDTVLADDAEITIDFDVAGTGTKGVKIYLIGYATALPS